MLPGHLLFQMISTLTGWRFRDTGFVHIFYMNDWKIWLTLGIMLV